MTGRKDVLVYDDIYMKHLEQVNPLRRKVHRWLPGPGWRAEGTGTAHEEQSSLKGHDNEKRQRAERGNAMKVLSATELLASQ